MDVTYWVIIFIWSLIFYHKIYANTRVYLFILFPYYFVLFIKVSTVSFRMDGVNFFFILEMAQVITHFLWRWKAVFHHHKTLKNICQHLNIIRKKKVINNRRKLSVNLMRRINALHICFFLNVLWLIIYFKLLWFIKLCIFLIQNKHFSDSLKLACCGILKFLYKSNYLQ